jgi:KDO2-lipid IV(A) lauroyltransferase
MLPPRILSFIASSLAFLIFSVFRVRRHLLERNIDIALGDNINPNDRTKIAARSLYHFFLTCLEFFAAKKYPLGHDCTVVGAEHITAALAEKRGVYVLTTHMGNWEAMGIVSYKFAPVYVPVKNIGNETLNKFVAARREFNGLHTIKREHKGTGIRAMIKMLNHGGVVGFMMDQARPGEPLLPFFSRPAQTNTSLAAISRRFPAPIVPAYMLRNEDLSYTLYFLPALELPQHEDGDREIELRSRYFNQVVEKIILRCPEQYFWLHDRWKLLKEETTQ